MANAKRQRVLVTGALGKVGVRVVQAFHSAGWEVVASDVVRGVFDTPTADAPDPLGRGGATFRGTPPSNYQQADLTAAGDVLSMLLRFKPDVVVHVAAIPDLEHNSPSTVFCANVSMTFNVVEACVATGVPRLVYVSSEQAPGFFSNKVATAVGVEWHPDYAPVDEEHRCAPSNPYALSKQFGELLCDAAVLRAGGKLSAISIRPSWCQDERNIERNLGPHIRDQSLPQDGLWSYIDIYDLADAIVLAAQTPTPGHEVVYVAAADNIGNRDLAAAIKCHYPSTHVRPLDRVDASGISSAKAKRLLGWVPRRSWKDYLDNNGRLKTLSRL